MTHRLIVCMVNYLLIRRPYIYIYIYIYIHFTKTLVSLHYKLFIKKLTYALPVSDRFYHLNSKLLCPSFLLTNIQHYFNAVNGHIKYTQNYSLYIFLSCLEKKVGNNQQKSIFEGPKRTHVRSQSIFNSIFRFSSVGSQFAAQAQNV